MKKIFSFAIVVAAVAMIGCCGNANNKTAEAEAQTECANCENAEGCCEKTDSCCCEKAAAEEAAK
ncbi:MAG: hypothetical protein NC250_03415 [Alistipes senegalensis]|nr:hypothetical protein [Bacteroides cellulosilyticus]MCM1351765.1 hypothetical protein [Alistipes senegalensis]